MRLIPLGLSLSLLPFIPFSSPILANPNISFLQAQTPTTASQELTEARIRSILREMGTARNQKSVEGILKHIAPFIHSMMTIELDGDTVVMSVEGKASHQDLLTDIYSQIKDRKILQQQVDIRISKDGQMAVAVIKEQTEFTSVSGESFLSYSIDTLRFGLVNGQPMVVSATLKGWLSPTATTGSR